MMIKKYLLLALSLILIGTLPLFAANSKAEQWSYPSKDPGLSSFKGSGTASSPYLIQSAQDLANLAYIVTDANNDVTGKHFKMTRDIYLNDFTVDSEGKITNNGSDLKEWTPIGEWGYFLDDDFEGVFDGAGYTIYGLYINEPYTRHYVGLFGSIENAVIKNLTIKNAYISATYALTFSNFGAAVGIAYSSTISNVNVEGCFIQFPQDQKNCYLSCGGLIGKAYKNITITDCSFDGTMRHTALYESYIGGLLGAYDPDGSNNTLRLTRCRTNGNIMLERHYMAQNLYVAGIVGYEDSGNSSIYIADVVNRMNIAVTTKESERIDDLYACNLSYSAKEITRSANLGDISLNAKEMPDVNLCLSYDCSNITNTVNYGHYSISDNRSISAVTIKAGDNSSDASNTNKNIVWSEARPTNLGSGDSYSVGGATEASVKDLDNKVALIRAYNADLHDNVWGLIGVTAYGLTYKVPCPVSCGGELLYLYQNDKGQYLITSEADLRYLQASVKTGSDLAKGSFRLTQDIDLSNSAPLEQIGDETRPFTGTFDGGGNIISGMTINGRGLFGNLSGTVKNLGLVNMRFIGGNALCAPFAYKAGVSDSASIVNCYAGGNIILGDSVSTDNSTTLAGLIYEANDNKVSIKNCYFRGLMTNATTVNNQEHTYYGLVGSNKIDSGLTITDSYSSFDFDATDKRALAVGIMPTRIDDKRDFEADNCHYLCSRISDPDGKVTTNAALAACFTGKDGWTMGAYRPILNSVRYYTLTDYQGQTIYVDAIPMDDDSCRNDIFSHEITRATENDPLLWALPNVAHYDADSGISRIVNCTLHPEAPFHYTPLEDSETKGQLHYPLTFTGDNPIRLMCLPATLHKSNLPDDARLFVLGKPQGSKDTGYTSYTVACDSVPAGVPFLISVSTTDTIDIVLRGDIVTEPQKSGELEGETFESGLIGTFSQKHIDGGCASVELESSDSKIKYEEDFDLQPFCAYFDADADVTCSGGVILDETSNDISEVIEAYHKWPVSVYLVRSLHAGAWNTLCVPFDITEAEIANKWGNGTKVEELTSVTVADGTCTLGFTKTSSIKAGKCYLIKPEKVDKSLVQFDNKTLCTAPDSTTLTASDGSFTLTFHGSFARKVLDGSDTSKGIYFTQDNKIYKVAATSTIPMNGFRCWIETSKPNVLNQTKIAHSDGTTSIANVVCIGTTKNDNRIYDLQGIEVRQPQRHHIYIKNNRKVTGGHSPL